MVITSRNDLYQTVAAGKASLGLSATTTTSSTTAAAAGSGFISLQFSSNSIGTTWPGTLISVPAAPFTNAHLPVLSYQVSGSANRGTGLCRLYKIGTLNLTATGDQFTHDSATFPVLRKIMGQSNTAVSLLPVLLLTTATATTAPVIRLQTSGGAAGYTDQDGNSTVGTVSFTFPSATTSVGSAFVLMLNSGDFAIRDINQIRVDTAASVGAATIYGMEILSLNQNLVSYPSTFDNTIGTGFFGEGYTPAVATSGTATSLLAPFSMSTSGWTHFSINTGVENV